MEYRGRSTKRRPRCEVSAGDTDQLDSTKAIGEAFQRKAFCRWQVGALLFLLPGNDLDLVALLLILARFLPPSVAEKYELDIPKYHGIEQIAEVQEPGRDTQKEKVIGLAERQV